MSRLFPSLPFVLAFISMSLTVHLGAEEVDPATEFSQIIVPDAKLVKLAEGMQFIGVPCGSMAA